MQNESCSIQSSITYYSLTWQYSRQLLNNTRQSPSNNAKGYVIHPCLGCMLKSPAAKLCGQEISDRILFGLGVYVCKFSSALADGTNEGMIHWSVHRMRRLIGGSREIYRPCLFSVHGKYPQSKLGLPSTRISETIPMWNITASYAKFKSV
jgi:hypothetical protein